MNTEAGGTGITRPETEIQHGATTETVPTVSASNGHRKWIICSIASVALIVLGGLLQGSMANRWGTPVKAAEIGAMLREIPMQVGPWVATEEQEMEKSALATLECQGYLLRTYVHQATGEAINVAVLFGPKGPIAVHTPEICYSSRAFQQTSLRVPQENDFDGMENKFWRLGFASNTIDKQKMSVAYAWSDGGAWVAAEAPRFWRADYLYKIQTASRMLNSKQDSTEEFFKDFLPELRKHMGLKPS
ncbi:MAG: exosortase-associated EpsI family protein [Planctomycetota bacterium]